MDERNTIVVDWNTSRNEQFGTIKEKKRDSTALTSNTTNADNFTIMLNCTIALMMVDRVEYIMDF